MKRSPPRRRCRPARSVAPEPGAPPSPTTPPPPPTGSRSRRRSTRCSTSPTGSPATTPRSTNLTAPGGEPHDLEPQPKETADDRRGRPGLFRARLPARGRRRRRRERHRRRARRRRRRRPGAVPRPRRRRPTRTTRTSGRTRCCSPTSATRSRRSSRRSTRTTPTTTRPTPPTCAPTSSSSTRSTPTGLTRLRARHDRGRATTRSATCSATASTMEAILGLSPDAEPTPADLARLQDLIEDDGRHHGLLRAAGQPGDRRGPGPRHSASSSEVLDPIEGLSDETADEDYLSLMRPTSPPSRRRTAVEHPADARRSSSATAPSRSRGRPDPARHRPDASGRASSSP